jgi:adenylate cyclase
MNIKLSKNVIVDLAAAVAMLVWFVLPLGAGPVGAFVPYTFPFSIAKYVPFAVPRFLAYLVYAVPAFAAWRIAASFLSGRFAFLGQADGLPACVTRIFVAFVMLGAHLYPLFAFADSPAWFASCPPLAYAAEALAFALSVIAVYSFLSALNFRNPVYREYRDFRINQKTVVTTEKQDRAAAFLEVFFKIRSKLFFAFIGIISATLLSVSITLLNNYRATILEAVGDGAKSQVEQASTNYRVNLGDSIALFEYLNRASENNAKAKFEYKDLTIYTNMKQELYLDSIADQAEDYRAEYSTLANGVQFPDLPAFAGASAIKYAKLYKDTGRVIEASDAATRTISYLSPIVKVDTIHNGDVKVKRDRVLGFSVMTFSVDTVMKPYYRTRNLVFVITAFFLYLAIVLSYVVGNYIVNPLLFLRMNVRKISDVLLTMIRGQARVSAQSLVYVDCVTSRDEIKSLSTEINDMVTVIRGIVPYISASTLKQAEKGVASTQRKDLAFLFTDIRGFTTLCEGMRPEEVVDILNQYLDLETEIILNNHGDVDKFVGDEMMAFFEGPLKEENSCRAAMQIRHAMMEQKERREKEGLPVVSIGIGINSGPVTFGSVGARDRMDFTSIGDTVNLAARLEGANKAYGSKSIITEAVYSNVQEHFLCRELDYIAVKGKNEPVRIYEILQEVPRAQPKLIEIKTLFEKGLAAYRAREWEKAGEAFRKNIELYNDAPSAVFLDRITHFSHNPPPEDWDGVFRMTVK